MLAVPIRSWEKDFLVLSNCLFSYTLWEQPEEEHKTAILSFSPPKLIRTYDWSKDKDLFNSVLRCCLGNPKDDQCPSKAVLLLLLSIDPAPQADEPSPLPWCKFRVLWPSRSSPEGGAQAVESKSGTTGDRQTGQLVCAENQLSIQERWNMCLQSNTQ